MELRDNCQVHTQLALYKEMKHIDDNNLDIFFSLTYDVSKGDIIREPKLIASLHKLAIAEME